METISKSFGEWIAGLEYGDIPGAALSEGKRCLVDVVGVALAGTRHDVGCKVREHVKREYAEGPCTLLGNCSRVSPSAAAFANAVAAHAYDFDDTCYAGIAHGSAVVLPAVLAAAEAEGVSGERLLTAFVAGVEIVYALGATVGDHLFFKGWHPTTVLGSIGATAGVAKILGLDADKTAQALGVAASQAGSLQTGKGTPVKPFLVGRAAENGVHFSRMAELGLVAPLDAFEKKRGFFDIVNDGKRDLSALTSLGSIYRLVDPGVAFKLYPVCSAAQAAAEETARILARENIDGDDVSEVLCEVTPLVHMSLDHDHPRTPVEAQFSMPFAVGCMLVFGDLGLAQLNEETLTKPHLRAVMSKVGMRISRQLADDPETSNKCPEGAFVTVRTVDGREINRFNGTATGLPANPMPDIDLDRKFRDCIAFAGEDADRAGVLLRRLRTVESLAAANLLAK